MDSKLFEKTTSATNDDFDNLLVRYWYNPRQKFTPEEQVFLKSRKEDFLLLAEGVDQGIPLLFCINQTGPRMEYKQGSFYKHNISMLRGPGDVPKGTFKPK